MQICLLEAGEKDTRHDKNHRSGSAARQGVHQHSRRVQPLAENGKKLAFLLVLL